MVGMNVVLIVSNLCWGDVVNKYKFSLVYKILTYPVTVEASDSEEAQTLFNDQIAIKMFPTNKEIEDFNNEFYSSWDIDTVEASCLNCGETPEFVGLDEDDFTLCPNGCFIPI